MIRSRMASAIVGSLTMSYQLDDGYCEVMIYNGEISPSNELDGGRFWSIEEIKNNLGKGVFTPNFESEFARLKF